MATLSDRENEFHGLNFDLGRLSSSGTAFSIGKRE
jgi:hypothetical protein